MELKTHEMEIKKLNDDLEKLVMKSENTATEFNCIHDISESIYYLTAADAMTKSERSGYSGNMNYSGRMMPNYDYSMADRRMGRDGDGDGYYSERGYMPRDGYSREAMGNPARY